MELTQQQAEEFVSEPHVAVFAVAADEGPPAAVPVWYGYEPGGDFWIITETHARKARLLRETGVATLVVDALEPRVRYASIDVELVGEKVATTEERTRLARRYMSEADADAYIAMGQDTFGPESVFTLRPRKWRTADLTPDGQPSVDPPVRRPSSSAGRSG